MTIATLDHHTAQPDMGAFDDRDEAVLNYLGLNPNNRADRAAVLVCRAYDLDAVLKHVVVIPRGGVYITRDGLLHIAHRSGKLDGIVVDQEPTIVNDEWVARVSVYRKDMKHPFTFPGRYPVNGGSNKQYAPEMALKAAEAHALRRAFAVAGLPTEDEQRPATMDDPTGGTGLSAAFAVKGDDGPHYEDSSAPVDGVEATDGEDHGDTASPSESPLLDVKGALARRMHAAFRGAGYDDRDAKLAKAAEVLGHPVESSANLTDDEASLLCDVLEGS